MFKKGDICWYADTLGVVHDIRIISVYEEIYKYINNDFNNKIYFATNYNVYNITTGKYDKIASTNLTLNIKMTRTWKIKKILK